MINTVCMNRCKLIFFAGLVLGASHNGTSTLYSSERCGALLGRNANLSSDPERVKDIEVAVGPALPFLPRLFEASKPYPEILQACLQLLTAALERYYRAIMLERDKSKKKEFFHVSTGRKRGLFCNLEDVSSTYPCLLYTSPSPRD